MRREEKKRVKIVREKLLDRRGMTMAELLIVVGIILALAGVSFIAVWSYQRSLAQLERDGIAKEIFVAAQNHLTAAKGEGYLGKDKDKIYFGEEDTVSVDENDNTKELKGDYYIVYSGSVAENSILNQMLPFGSIDETVRTGGSYVIRYQPDTATILDVFYCSMHGSPEVYNHKLGSVENEYQILVGLTGPEHKADRRTYTEGSDSVLGWYGHTIAYDLPDFEIEPPKITVYNKEILYVTVEDVNASSTKLTQAQKDMISIRLIIEGLSSGAKRAIPVVTKGKTTTTIDTTLQARVSPTSVGSSTYTVILDDVTTASMQFANLGADSGKFIPGENISIKAVAFSNSALTNIAYSGEQSTNSLFASISDNDTVKDQKFETAYISNIRHLENLDNTLSGLSDTDSLTSSNTEKFKISKAVQTSDLSWTGFQKGIKDITGSASETFAIYGKEGKLTDEGYYYPVSPNYDLSYNGQNYKISDISVNHAGPAGLFGNPGGTSGGKLDVSNLQLVDFSVMSTGTDGSAGALAGILDSGSDSVTNVVAYNTRTTPTGVKASDCAGGLIGSMGAGSVTASAAALIVEGEESAGGLIGTVSGNPAIKACFSGGHTLNGEYNPSAYNVTASTGTAGGLVGVADSATIQYSYSTCSVKGATCGGFVGSAGKTISNCYCTGLVGGDPADSFANNAFIGSGNPTITDSHYYEIINEIVTTVTSGNETKVTKVEYKGSGSSSGVTPFDASAADYNTFVGDDSSWKTANAYDPELRKYYAGKYCLKTVAQLGASSPAGYSWSGTSSDPNVTLPIPFVAAHYGDWPAPEIFVINESSN